MKSHQDCNPSRNKVAQSAGDGRGTIEVNGAGEECREQKLQCENIATNVIANDLSFDEARLTARSLRSLKAAKSKGRRTELEKKIAGKEGRAAECATKVATRCTVAGEEGRAAERATKVATHCTVAGEEGRASERVTKVVHRNV
ncbi:hypothetical protein H6P81_016701 [Aristolochia fimbriata]|uniref:Uncharacterized protein n=1 Tax=Aristolochia fimbriata TaxID=158543 RepID=A0AAV7EBZ2_ARIFI|nr:hypothetical protein H6P81_016701 [Aristolochia fimbriata]